MKRDNFTNNLENRSLFELYSQDAKGPPEGGPKRGYFYLAMLWKWVRTGLTPVFLPFS